jgi:hypothetical protein
MSLAPSPPPDPALNALWFDIVDLTPMVYVSDPDDPTPDVGGWVAIRPALGWQYEAFRSVARVSRVRTEFGPPDDYLSHEATADPGGLAGDIYHDEALAYAHWCLKSLAGQSNWEYAESVLSGPQFAAALPAGRLAWDEAEHPASEFVRLAFGRDTLNQDISDDDPGDEDVAALPIEQRMVFNEWERHQAIGFSTLVTGVAGRILSDAARTLIVDLDGSAATWLRPLLEKAAP